MAIDKGWLEALPPIPRSSDLGLSHRHRGLFVDGSETLQDQLLTRSLYWTLRIAEEAESWQWVERLPGYQWAHIGFLERSEDSSASRQGFNFGVLAFCDDPISRETWRLTEFGIDGFSFWVNILPGWFEPHVQVATPSQGCVTGWAVSRRSSAPRQGWLTAGHVAPSATDIGFSDGGVGQVIDRAGGCADAAVVSTTQLPTNLVPAMIAKALTAGREVRLYDQFGQTLETTIHGVDPALGVTPSKHWPLRFSLDDHGQPGDSGALVDDPSNDEVVGLYLGRYHDYIGEGASLGLGLAADYLTSLLDMEVFR